MPAQLQLLFSLKEGRIYFLDVLIKIVALQSRNCNVEVCVDDRDLIALIHAKVERLDVIVVGENSLDLGFDQYVRDEGGQMVCGYLLVFV